MAVVLCELRRKDGLPMTPIEGNLLLDALPRDYRASLIKRMEAIPLPTESVLYLPAEKPK